MFTKEELNYLKSALKHVLKVSMYNEHSASIGLSVLHKLEEQISASEPNTEVFQDYVDLLRNAP